MSQKNNIPKSRIVTADRFYLSIINDRVQDIYVNTEHLASALDAVKTNDAVSQGVIVAVKAAILANSELARIVSKMMDGLILLPEVEVESHES